MGFGMLYITQSLGYLTGKVGGLVDGIPVALSIFMIKPL